MDNLLYIKDDVAKKILDIPELFTEIESGLADLSRSKGDKADVVMPTRLALEANNIDKSGFMLVMPTIYQSGQTMACKILTMYPQNTLSPTHASQILHYDINDGRLLAVLDGNYITAIRTAVTSAVATKYLAKSDSGHLAILGSGVQARSHYLVFKEVFPHIKMVSVWSQTKKYAESFATEIAATCCETAKECVKNADIIITVTSSHTPVIKAEWLKPGTHINSVGAPRPHMQELDHSIMNQGVIYADHLQSVLLESGNVIKSQATVYAEIGEVILGRKEAFKNTLTVFDSVGIAIEDAIAAKHVYNRYIKSKNID